jgi:hypothetical protein
MFFNKLSHFNLFFSPVFAAFVCFVGIQPMEIDWVREPQQQQRPSRPSIMTKSSSSKSSSRKSKLTYKKIGALLDTNAKQIDVLLIKNVKKIGAVMNKKKAKKTDVLLNKNARHRGARTVSHLANITDQVGKFPKTSIVFNGHRVRIGGNKLWGPLFVAPDVELALTGRAESRKNVSNRLAHFESSVTPPPPDKALSWEDQALNKQEEKSKDKVDTTGDMKDDNNNKEEEKDTAAAADDKGSQPSPIAEKVAVDFQTSVLTSKWGRLQFGVNCVTIAGFKKLSRGRQQAKELEQALREAIDACSDFQ